MNAPLTLKDYETDQEVRWCPGCGDYAILKTVQKLMPTLGVPKENTVFVSGIGCSSRFPYYMNTYGFHTIHGRAPAVATGVKLANPQLDVWLVTGDGDGLSIGGNHMIHALRRNVDMQILLFNNEIYGLTKGQYSPTSKVGTKSPSTPDGSIDQPLDPAAFALGVGARFVEIYQNCNVYNDGIFELVKNKKNAAHTRLMLEHGEPMLFGADREKGLRLNMKTLALEIVTIGEDGVSLDDILVHDETNITIAQLLSRIHSPDFPEPFGVLYCNPTQAFVEDVYLQRIAVRETKGPSDVNAILRGGHTWTVA